MARRSDIDWESLQRDYRIGLLSIQMLSEKYSVNRVSISRKAKSESWTRDLSEQVQAAAQAKVDAMIVDNVTSTLHLSYNKDAMMVEVASDFKADIIRKHRKDLAANTQMMNTLVQRLYDQAMQVDTVAQLLDRLKNDDPMAWREMHKVMSLSSHIENLKKITEIHNNIITAERKAYNLDAEDKKALPELEAAIFELEARMKSVAG